MTRPTLRLVAAPALVATVALGGCAALPVAPEPLPATFIPEVTPSFSEPAIAVGDDGFTVVERVAMRVSVITCDTYTNGSAWVLDEDTVVTNRHVVEGAQEIELTSYDGHHYVGTSSVMADFADLALIEVDGTLPEQAVIAASPPEVRDNLSVVGYPEAGRLTTTVGAYEALEPETIEDGKDDVYRVSAPSKEGNSGSPVVNDQGEVVGVLYAGDNRFTSWVVTHDSLNRFLADPSLHVPNDTECTY